MFLVQINISDTFAYLIKKKETYLTYPTIAKDYEALDSCFISESRVALLANNKELRFMNFLTNDKVQAITLKDPFCITAIFPSNKKN